MDKKFFLENVCSNCINKRKCCLVLAMKKEGTSLSYKCLNYEPIELNKKGMYEVETYFLDRIAFDGKKQKKQSANNI